MLRSGEIFQDFLREKVEVETDGEGSDLPGTSSVFSDTGVCFRLNLRSKW